MMIYFLMPRKEEEEKEEEEGMHGSMRNALNYNEMIIQRRTLT